ncbi:Transmembrane gamma-carboxyglutamic acid protein like [Thalictrum thalictroides]|uniref:Transmembrane gamma-carboxyglutamic acid protein like n=1 Tax=Thalictrum thalictroides TaxID=46969 RepID=A0A7J6VNP0_THATH|nr:Transmembrane gamma-carboxyglutamic acid protein like [Thalictrum thalictroides]
MDASQNLSSFNCELRIIRAKNTEFISEGNLFVRYYLVTDNDKRIRLNSREIPTTSDPCWNQSIVLECLGTANAMDKLKQQSIVFELRWRKTNLFRKFSGSKLLFKAEVGWKDVFNSAELSILKWVTSPKTCEYVPEGLKPPALQIEMKIHDTRTLHMPKRCHMRSTKWNECGCRNGACNGRDEDVFALAAALHVL